MCLGWIVPKGLQEGTRCCAPRAGARRCAEAVCSCLFESSQPGVQLVGTNHVSEIHLTHCHLHDTVPPAWSSLPAALPFPARTAEARPQSLQALKLFPAAAAEDARPLPPPSSCLALVSIPYRRVSHTSAKRGGTAVTPPPSPCGMHCHNELTSPREPTPTFLPSVPPSPPLPPPSACGGKALGNQTSNATADRLVGVSPLGFPPLPLLSQRTNRGEGAGVIRQSRKAQGLPPWCSHRASCRPWGVSSLCKWL